MMNEQLKSKLEELLEQLEDTYGSEATSPGEVFETTSDDIEQAALECLGEKLGERPVREDLPFGKFRSHDWISFEVEENDNPESVAIIKKHAAAHDRFMELIDPFAPQYARIGNEEFAPSDDFSPGGFFHCLLIKDGSGKNLLIAFDCAMT